MEKIKIKRTHGGKVERNTELDSGYDVFAMGYRQVLNGELLDPIWFDESPISKNRVGINSDETILILTGIQMRLPKPKELENGYRTLEAQIRGRSGMSLKTDTSVKLGTVDNEYVGIYGVIFKNESNKTYIVDKGDKIAQVVFNEVYIPKESGTEFVDDFDEDTDRGNGGFGKSGK